MGEEKTKKGVESDDKKKPDRRYNYLVKEGELAGAWARIMFFDPADRNWCWIEAISKSGKTIESRWYERKLMQWKLV